MGAPDCVLVAGVPRCTDTPAGAAAAGGQTVILACSRATMPRMPGSAFRASMTLWSSPAPAHSRQCIARACCRTAQARGIAQHGWRRRERTNPRTERTNVRALSQKTPDPGERPSATAQRATGRACGHDVLRGGRQRRPQARGGQREQERRQRHLRGARAQPGSESGYGPQGMGLCMGREQERRQRHLRGARAQPRTEYT